jgi:4'-phosphopantetheinyl transferase
MADGMRLTGQGGVAGAEDRSRETTGPVGTAPATPSTWPLSPDPPPLERDEVHVWRAVLDVGPRRLEALRDTLDPDERRRAARFVFARDRDRFVAGRGTLRELLARYLGRAPGELAFSYGPHGKPAVAGAARDLRFNLSHAGGLALYAVAEGRELGIDVETMRPDFATERIAERFFSPAERAALRRVAAEQRCEAFFACWTRKEAYMKALGRGFSLPLDAFDVSLAPGEPAALLATREDPADRERWWLSALDAGPGVAAALAVEGARCAVRCAEWLPP